MKSQTILFIFCLFLFVLQGCTDVSPEAPEKILPQPQSAVPSPEYDQPEYEAAEPECQHFWSSPDCNNSSFCYDCGEIKGTPLPHEWADANYQKASECLKCGMTEGAALEPEFIVQGYQINATAGRSYPYKTTTSLDGSMITYGTATLLYIDIFESDTGYKAKEGYEYIRVRFMIYFDDENALINGYKYMTGQLDYYGMDPEEIPVAYEDLSSSEIPGFKVANRKINYYGVDYEYYIKYELIQNEWVGDIAYIVREHVFLVPAGYDGLVMYFANAANWTNYEKSITKSFDSDTLFFRLATQSR